LEKSYTLIKKIKPVGMDGARCCINHSNWNISLPFTHGRDYIFNSPMVSPPFGLLLL
jgi:hypothetical protein